MALVSVAMATDAILRDVDSGIMVVCSHVSVIGRGGETLHKIVAETNCKLNIAHDSGGLPERIVTLVGTKDSIE